MRQLIYLVLGFGKQLKSEMVTAVSGNVALAYGRQMAPNKDLTHQIMAPGGAPFLLHCYPVAAFAGHQNGVFPSTAMLSADE